MPQKNLIESIFGGGRKIKAAFLALIVALAASVLVLIFPDRTDAILSIAGTLSVVIMVLIGGVAFEDAVSKWAARPRYTPDLNGLLQQLQTAAAELEKLKKSAEAPPDESVG